MLEALPCLCIYLMMDGHKHHAVVVEHMMILLAVLTLWCSLLTGSKKTVKFAPGICGSMSILPCAYIIFVYTVTFFNSKQAVLFSNRPGVHRAYLTSSLWTLV